MSERIKENAAQKIILDPFKNNLYLVLISKQTIILNLIKMDLIQTYLRWTEIGLRTFFIVFLKVSKISKAISLYSESKEFKKKNCQVHSSMDSSNGSA